MAVNLMVADGGVLGTLKSDTLYINSEAYKMKQRNMQNVEEMLILNTGAFEKEGEVCGTESMDCLADYWHNVEKTDKYFHDFVCKDLDNLLDKILLRVNQESDNTAKGLEKSLAATGINVASTLNILTALAIGAIGATGSNTENVPDKRGTKYGIDEEGFLKVTDTDKNGNEVVYFGGSQAWFTAEENKKHNIDVDINGYGCGVIAAVNEALYLSGVTEISKDDYMDLVYSYFDSWNRKYELNDGWPVLGKGATPMQLQDFIESECKKRGVKVDANWDYTDMDMEERYQYMKQSVQDNKPVIWGIHDNDGDVLHFYTYDESTEKMQESWQKVSSHYVTVTAVYESYDANGREKRYVEISSYGEKCYVLWDEFIKFVDVKIDTNGSTGERVVEFMEDGVANTVGSSVMVID